MNSSVKACFFTVMLVLLLLLFPLLQSVYDFAYTDQSLPMKFTLVTHFPRKELLVETDGGPPLADLKLGRRCALFVQDDTA